MNIIQKFFSFDWLKSEERKELEQLRKEREQLKLDQEKLNLDKQSLELDREHIKLDAQKEVLDNLNEKIEEVVNQVNKKPYKSVRVIGSDLIVVLWDGLVLEGSPDLLDKVRAAQTEGEVIELFHVKEEVIASTPYTHHEDTPEEKQSIKDNLRVFRDHSDFEIKDEKVFMKGISLELPGIVAATFIEILEKLDGLDGMEAAGELGLNEEEDFDKLREQYQALKMFWLKLAVNPIEQSRNQLLAFVKKNDVRITATGNLVLYRKIVKTSGEDTTLVDFVSQQYEKVKRWKKSPKNYFVVEEVEVVVVEEEVEEEVFDTDYDYEEDDEDYNEDDSYTTKTVIRPTKVEKKVLKLRKTEETFSGDIKGNLQDLYLELPNMKANSYTSQSNRGKYTIKVGSIYKIDESELNTDASVCHGGGLHAANVNYDYGGYGDTPVVVLVNPSKALTVPHSDMGKIRVTEMFIMAVNDKPRGEHYDDYLIQDEEYNQYSIDELQKAVDTKDFSSLNMKDKTVAVNEVDIAAITEQLKNRIVKI